MKAIEVVFLLVLFISSYFLVYLSFAAVFKDDIEFNFGKHHLRSVRKSGEKSLIKRFLFIDVRRKIKPIHYVSFWINLVSFLSLLTLAILIQLEVAENKGWIRAGILCNTIFFGGTLVIISFSYWSLYRGNIVRSRARWRKNNRK